MGKHKKLIKQAPEHVSTAKIVVWYTISNLLSKGVAFITTPIFTRLLSKSQFGEFNNFTSWISIISILATFDLSASIARAKYDYNERIDQFLSSITLFSNTITLALYVIVECFSDFFCSLFSMDIIYIRFMFLYIMFWPAFSYMQAKHRIFQKYKFFVFFSVSSVLIAVVSSALLMLLMQDRLYGRIAGYVIPVTIMNSCLWLHIVKRGKSASLDYIKYACAISIPLIPHQLSLILLGHSDRVMIERFCGSEANAMYSLAYQISLLANLLWISMNQAWTPWLFDRIHEENYEKIRQTSKIFLGVFSVLVIGVLLVTPEIILIMGGSVYYETQFVMPPVILGCCFQFVYTMYVNIELYEKKTMITPIATISAALLNIILNAIFIPKFGYIVAAYTTLVGYVALFIFHYLIVNIYIEHLSSIYDKRLLFITLLLLCFVSALSLLLFRLEVNRYILIALYLAICIIVLIRNRNVILKNFRR